jgi:hypothetical protein
MKARTNLGSVGKQPEAIYKHWKALGAPIEDLQNAFSWAPAPPVEI